MAAIFKRRKGRGEPYTIQYEDHFGNRKTCKGFTDKGLTEQLAAKLESESRLRKTGLIDPTLEKAQEHRLAPIETHLAAFSKTIADNTPKYVGMILYRLRRINTQAEFSCLDDITSEKVLAALQKFQEGPKFGLRTYNHYLQAFSEFCQWCADSDRLMKNPVAILESVNAEVDIKRKRRALTAEEFHRLVDAAKSSKRHIQRFDGEARARIYMISYLTGLRKSEIASLMPCSFDLTASPPMLTVEAAASKHKRTDTLPLHPELVASLPNWIKGLKADEKLFPRLERCETAVMVRKDLEQAGIPYETPKGVADFHAAGRHTHITELLRNGASLPETKELARHSDIRMTLRYTHIGIEDQAEAVTLLKVPKTKSAALHGRCNFGGFEGHCVSSGDNGATAPDASSPMKTLENVTTCHSMTSIEKMPLAGLEPARGLRPSRF